MTKLSLLAPAFLLSALTTTGCTGFAMTRSAVVHPGPQVSAQYSKSTSPGADAGWFWGDECDPCTGDVVGIDANVGWALRDQTSAVFMLGVGLNGVYPYVEAYRQAATARGRRPFGFGARLGIPFGPWSEHQVYSRIDFPLSPSTTVLWNPGVMLHIRNRPDDQNSGHFIGLLQGFGLQWEKGAVSLVPAATYILGRTERTRAGARIGPSWKGFGTMSFGVHLHSTR